MSTAGAAVVNADPTDGKWCYHLHGVVEDGNFHHEQARHREDALDVVVLHEELEALEHTGSLSE